jgi:hypothetical protein
MFDGDLSAASWTANSLAPVRFLPDAQICGGGGGAQLDPQLIRVPGVVYAVRSPVIIVVFSRGRSVVAVFSHR